MKGIIFDMDGVLIDAMPFHAEAMRIAINEETGHNIDKKIVCLLEGMPGPELIIKMETISLRKRLAKEKRSCLNKFKGLKPSKEQRS